jgi:hypothetical protein
VAQPGPVRRDACPRCGAIAEQSVDEVPGSTTPAGPAPLIGSPAQHSCLFPHAAGGLLGAGGPPHGRRLRRVAHALPLRAVRPEPGARGAVPRLLLQLMRFMMRRCRNTGCITAAAYGHARLSRHHLDTGPPCDCSCLPWRTARCRSRTLQGACATPSPSSSPTKPVCCCVTPALLVVCTVHDWYGAPVEAASCARPSGFLYS